MSPLRQIHPLEVNTEVRDREYKKLILHRVQVGLLSAAVILLILLFLQGHGWAQTGLTDTGNQIKHMICDSGCSSSSSPSYGTTFPATGTPIGFKQGANLSWGTVDGSNNLNMNCVVGCGASGFGDNAAFTAGTSNINIMGGWYSTSPTNCTSGSACAPQLTLDRKLFVQAFQGTSPWVVSQPTGSNLHVVVDTAPTTAVTQSTSPWVDSVTTWGGGTLGAMANYGTSPGAVLVPGVNSFITNIPHVVVDTAPSTAVTNAGTFAVQAAESGTWNVTINTALPAGTAVIGHVIADSGSTTAVTGTVAVTESGTWTNRVVGNAGASLDAATGAAPPANAILHAGLASGATGGFMTGIAVSDTYKPINVSTATTTLLVTGVSGRQVRIGSINLITASANNVALIEGTGATCGTGSAGMNGGTTGASGWNFAANGGIAYGSGLGTIMQTATTGDSVCIVTSAAVQLSGGMQYTIY